MEINIWSDVRCPFCYIGKHKFEEALQKFPNRDKIKVTWHSFELDPYMKTEPGVNSLDHFSKIKGVSRAQAEQMMDHVKKSADGTGVTFNFDKSVVANSFNAHRLIQLAKTKGKANEIEEALFKAHFTDGVNIDDWEELKKIALSAGITEADFEALKGSDKFEAEVRKDEEKAQELGISGVPFFVLNNKYGVSGAQPSEIFLQAMQQSYAEYIKDNPPLIVDPFGGKEGASCDLNGNCD